MNSVVVKRSLIGMQRFVHIDEGIIPRKTLMLHRLFSSSPVPASTPDPEVPMDSTYERALSNPINFDSSSSIQGEESQILQVHLKPNQVLRAESGAMLFMTQGVEMSTGLGSKDGSFSTSSITDGLKRMLTGQNMFLSDYTYHGDANTSGTIALGTDFPSKILRLSLTEYDGKIVAQKGAYLASSIDVNIQMEFTKKFSTGFFGGEGFILQSLTGTGDVFVKAGGTLVKKELSAGETLRISSGSLVAMTQDVSFDITTMPGFKNVLFGGEGLFVTTLSGPGTVWLQGMPADRMISEIARRIPSGGIGIGIPIGMGTGSSESVESSDVESSSNESISTTSDAAIDADRNATVASSGIATDSESPSALFGDAAPEGIASVSEESRTPGLEKIPHLENEEFNSDLTKDSDDFEMDSSPREGLQDFDDDNTSFSTMKDEKYENDADESFTEPSDESSGGIGSFFSSIWDMFRDDD